MPHPLGEFISREVYNNRLFSEHKIKDPSCVAFIDTKTGTEEKSGFSWQVGLFVHSTHGGGNSYIFGLEHLGDPHNRPSGQAILQRPELLHYHPVRRAKSRHRERTQER